MHELFFLVIMNCVRRTVWLGAIATELPTTHLCSLACQTQLIELLMLVYIHRNLITAV